MRYLVTVKASCTLSEEKEAQQVRHTCGEKFKELRNAGKLIEGGLFVDAPGGFFLLDVDTPSELFRLLAPLQESCEIETLATTSSEGLEELAKTLAS
jgi:hypothetical protein